MVQKPIALTVFASCVERGGAETVLSHLLLGLDRSRFQPRLCCLRKEPGKVARELQAQGIPLTCGLAHMKYDPFVGRRLVRAIGPRTDLLYCLDHHQALFWVPYLLRRAPIKRSVLSCHATRNPSGGRIFRAGERKALQQMQRIIAVAHGQKQELIDNEGIAAEHVEVIHNGVAVADFGGCRSRVADRVAVRHSWGLNEGHRVAMIVAQLRPEKNHAAFLRIAQTISARLPRARFVIVGDGPERAPLERYSRELGIARRVQFTGLRHDIPRVLAAADVVTLTSKVETFPMALLEGMAAGKPVVAPQVGSIAELVDDGITGHLIPNGDEGKFAAALQELLADEAKATAMGAAGHRVVQRQFTVEHMVRAYESLFETLVDGES